MTRTLELLDRLVGFPTVSQDSNLDLIEWAEGLLRDWGFDVTRIPSPTKNKAGLFARIGPPIDGGICLSGHTDVVPVTGQDWTRPQFTLSQDGNRVYGRGTTDMKGYVAAALAAAERASRMTLHAPLSLVLSYDEEVGCIGIQEMMPALKPLIGKPKAVIVGEPTSMQMAIGHKGKTALRVICNGEAGHSALAPNFTNAIHVAAHFIDQIRALQDRLAGGVQDTDYDIPYSTVHIGKIAGGTALNIVPDRVEMAMEYRYLPDNDADIVRAIEAAMARTNQAFHLPHAIAIEPVTAYPGLNIDAAHPVINWAHGMTGGATTGKVAFGTEAGVFADIGVDAIVIGPGDMATDGHKPDEGISVDQLAACDDMMAKLLQDLSGG